MFAFFIAVLGNSDPALRSKLRKHIARAPATRFLPQEFYDHGLSAILHLDETGSPIHTHFGPKHRETGWLRWEDTEAGDDSQSRYDSGHR